MGGWVSRHEIRELREASRENVKRIEEIKQLIARWETVVVRLRGEEEEEEETRPRREARTHRGVAVLETVVVALSKFLEAPGCASIVATCPRLRASYAARLAAAAPPPGDIPPGAWIEGPPWKAAWELALALKKKKKKTSRRWSVKLERPSKEKLAASLFREDWYDEDSERQRVLRLEHASFVLEEVFQSDRNWVGMLASCVVVDERGRELFAVNMEADSYAMDGCHCAYAWDVETGEFVDCRPEENVGSPRGRRVWLASCGQHLLQYSCFFISPDSPFNSSVHLPTGSIQLPGAHFDPVPLLAHWAFDGRRVVVSSNSPPRLHIVNAVVPSLERTLDCRPDLASGVVTDGLSRGVVAVRCCSNPRDGSLAILAVVESARRGRETYSSLQLWDAASGTLLHESDAVIKASVDKSRPFLMESSGYVHADRMSILRDAVFVLDNTPDACILEFALRFRPPNLVFRRAFANDPLRQHVRPPSTLYALGDVVVTADTKTLVVWDAVTALPRRVVRTRHCQEHYGACRLTTRGFVMLESAYGIPGASLAVVGR